jgi:ornithine decarboxylase
LACGLQDGFERRSTLAQGSEVPPYFLIDQDALRANVSDFRAAFPSAGIYYALKANSEPFVLATLADAGCGFEAASWPEIERLLALGIAPRRIIYGTAVKPRAHIERAAAAGIDRFAADSREELALLSAVAPRTSVFIRVKVDDADSVYRMSVKFGALPEQAAMLIRLARDLRLVPWGLSFNVGSQARSPAAWAVGLSTLAPIMSELASDGIRLENVNIGGGYPAEYDNHPTIGLDAIAGHVCKAAAQLPYPVSMIIEPGRRLVATSTSLVASVVSRIERPDGTWLFLDCGVYNALFEALSCQGAIRYRVTRIGREESNPISRFVLAGPTGDGLDVICRDSALPANMAVGDTLVFENVGAYTLSLASSFNGFAPPPVYVQKAAIGERGLCRTPMGS